MHPFRSSLVIATVCAASSASFGAPTHDDLVYATVGGQPLHLDLYLPAEAGPDGAPLVVFIHGGGWQNGTHNNLPFVLRQAAKDHGIAVASVQYRLTSQAGQWGGESVVFPAQIHDVKAAIRFLRANADAYDLDDDRIITWGSSAGAHLALLAALAGEEAGLEGEVGDHDGVSTDVIGAVSLFGPTNLLTMNDDVVTPPGTKIDHDSFNSPESRLLGWSKPGQGIADIKANLDNPNAPYPSLVELANSASPEHHADAADPPVLMVHGTEDAVVAAKQSMRLQTTLRRLGVDAQLESVFGGGHGQGFGAHEHDLSLRWAIDRFTEAANGQSACGSDINGNGIVDLADLNAVLAAFGQVCP